MKKFSYIKLVALSALFFWAIPTFGQNNVVDEVIWMVGDNAILKSDVEEAILFAKGNYRRFDGDPYCIVPEELAVTKLFLHQAALDSIEVSDGDVVRRVEYVMQDYLEKMGGSRERLEEYFNKTYTQIRETLRENVREGLTVQTMQQHLVKDIKVTPAEVRRFFANLSEDSIPYIPTQVEVQIITQQPAIPVEEIDDVKARLRDYTERVNSGEIEFSTLARLYSEDQGTSRAGGETGFRGRGEWVPEFATVAFNLQDPKRISKVVETEFGFHIIQLIEKRGDRANVRHILLRPKVSEKELKESMVRLDSLADHIRNNKVSFEAAAILSHDKDTRNNYGLLANPETLTSRFEMGELPQEVAKKVENMKVGEISDAFTMINPKDGKEVCAIIKLKSRINGHKATMSEDYQRLKAIVEETKQEEFLQKWILQKQKQTYIRINENWRNCDFKYPGWIKE